VPDTDALPEGRTVTAATSSGAELIAAERQRQIDAEGWTTDHDDGHDEGELALAAACYAIPDDGDASEPVRFPTRSLLDGKEIPPLWPWEGRWYKRTPHDRRRELVKAGALIAAEIDRLQRAEHPAAQDQDARLISGAKDRIARVVVALQDGSRPAVERLAHEALDLLNQVKNRD